MKASFHCTHWHCFWIKQAAPGNIKESSHCTHWHCFWIKQNTPSDRQNFFVTLLPTYPFLFHNADIILHSAFSRYIPSHLLHNRKPICMTAAPNTYGVKTRFGIKKSHHFWWDFPSIYAPAHAFTASAAAHHLSKLSTIRPTYTPCLPFWSFGISLPSAFFTYFSSLK